MKCEICYKPFEKKTKYETLCLRCWDRRKKLGVNNFNKINSIRKVRRQTLLNRIFRIIKQSEFIHPICKNQVINEIKMNLKNEHLTKRI